MSVIKGEILEAFINNGNFKVDVLGPLHFPIRNLKIERDESLDLILTTTSDSNSELKSIDHPPGTVRINNDAIELTNISKSKVKMNGVQPFKYTVSTDSNGNSIRTELSSGSFVEADIRDVETGAYLIEWLENVDDKHFIWPDSIKTSTKSHTLVSIGKKPNKVEMKEEPSSEEFRSGGLFLEVGKNKLYLVNTGDDAKSVGVKSGYILYLGIPSSNERKKIRNCLSFVLGRPLIKTGYSIFNEEWLLVSFKSISAYSFGGAAFLLHSLPPYPLGENYQGEVNSNIITPLVNAIYDNYEEYKFGHLSWAYWHAVCAPVHIAAVHFGACIESLQKSYIEKNGKIFNSALIEKTKFKKLRKATLEVLASLELEETEYKVMESKINSLNQTPQSVLTERFLGHLDIEFSDAEKSAWQQRNNAVHGNEIEEGSQIQLIKEIKILKVIFHRVLLRIINGGEYYTDYYSIGFPIKNIRDSVDKNV